MKTCILILGLLSYHAAWADFVYESYTQEMEKQKIAMNQCHEVDATKQELCTLKAEHNYGALMGYRSAYSDYKAENSTLSFPDWLKQNRSDLPTLQ